MSMKTIKIQPAEKYMDPGQIKVSVEHQVDGRVSNSSSMYIPEALFYMLPAMVDSYRTKQQSMTGHVVIEDE